MTRALSARPEGKARRCQPCPLSQCGFKRELDALVRDLLPLEVVRRRQGVVRQGEADEFLEIARLPQEIR